MATATFNQIQTTPLLKNARIAPQHSMLQRAAITPIAHGVLQRCSNGVECPACRAKREQREQQEGTLQRAAVNTAPTPAVPPVVHDVLSSPGQPLDRDARSFMEPRFGHDFSGVRVHTDARAAESARAVNALAYTVGRDVVFGTGQYMPQTMGGKRLLAHELTHVVQQNQRANSSIQTMSIGEPDSAAEREASTVSNLLSIGEQVVVQNSSTKLERYAHRDCAEDDLHAHVWPADWQARQMTQKAIRVLSASPIDARVTPLLTKYFMSATPAIPTILSVYQSIKDEFDKNDYIYECENNCSGTDLGYVYGIWSHVHLCMSRLRSVSNDCMARTIVHEFSHYYASTKDNAYCKSGCGYDTCPTSLSTSQALKNADSYACFAYELFSIAV